MGRMVAPGTREFLSQHARRGLCAKVQPNGILKLVGTPNAKSEL